MKTILVPVEESTVLPSMLETALLAARRFGGQVDGLHVRPALPGVVAAGAAGLVAATPDLVESFERQDRERTERAQSLFNEFMRAKGVGPTPVADAPNYGWIEETSPGDDAVGSRGRSYDLIVVGRPVRGQTTPAMSTLEAALFESGRPLLIAPPHAPAALGNNICIAWNGSTETARTIAFAMPFLLRARKVTVVTIEGAFVPGPSGADMARNLARNGIPVDVIDAKDGGRPPGEAMLAEATASGADMMVKGAYTHSRLRQMIFGGATSQILAAAEMPIFMAH